MKKQQTAVGLKHRNAQKMSAENPTDMTLDDVSDTGGTCNDTPSNSEREQYAWYGG